MNKKKLSVVMAGAMLASSVAPVLAATESEVDSSKLGSLVETVHAKLISERFTAGTGDPEAGKSLYLVKIGDRELTDIDKLTVAGSEEALRIALQEEFKNLTAGDKVEIYSKGSAKDEKGNIVSEEITTPVYLKSDINADLQKSILKSLTNSASLTGEINGSYTNTNLVSNKNEVVLDSTNKEIRVYLPQNIAMDLPMVKVNLTGTEKEYKVLTIKEGVAKYRDDLKYVLLSGKSEGIAITQSEPTDVTKVVGFERKPLTSADKSDIKNTLEETIKITGTQYNYKTEDLYDGLMLTTAGHDMLSLVKEIRHDKEKNGVTTTAKIMNLSKTVTYTEGKNIDLEKVNSEFGFVLVVKDAFNKTTEYTVKGAEKQTEVLASWLNTELAKVDILAGDNRYETAVEIAKEQAQVNAPKFDNGTTKIKDIVLVNGNSLVDGLSAAPLASHLQNKVDGATTPVLLTEADELPKATRAYLIELMTNQIIGDSGKVTVHLVGGTTVLNRSLEKELESFGFTVKRYNGDNREETSLKVADEINNTSAAFVVGAEGEADAMSISGYASKKGIPVIVSKKGGLTYEGLKELKDKAVTVIGGENAVSAAEFEAIKEEASAVRRIAGANRQATNAAIIKEFYHNGSTINGINNQESVIVAKDGRAKKTDLVDALTAANLAAQTNAPVVLAKSSLSDEQLDALQLRAKSAESLYQVGIGVERSVVETIASKLGLLNK